MDSRRTDDPFDSVRDAFEELGTSEKAAFVLEATFATLGQALAETGRRAASAIDDLDIDSWFRPYATAARDVGAPPPPPPAPDPPVSPSPKAPTAKKPPARKTPPKKTAGKTPRRRPPADDA